jgi:hypothetical protein
MLIPPNMVVNKSVIYAFALGGIFPCDQVCTRLICRVFEHISRRVASHTTPLTGWSELPMMRLAYIFHRTDSKHL